MPNFLNSKPVPFPNLLGTEDHNQTSFAIPQHTPTKLTKRVGIITMRALYTFSKYYSTKISWQQFTSTAFNFTFIAYRRKEYFPLYLLFD